VTWRPLHHCSMDLDEPCSQVLVEIERFWSAGGQHNTWSAGVVQTRFQRTGQIGSGGLAATGPVAACRPPDQSLAYSQCSGDRFWRNASRRAREEAQLPLFSDERYLFSDHSRKPHSLFLREFEALCCSSDSLATFFPEALIHEIYLQCLFYRVHRLMPWASFGALFWHHFFRAVRPQKLLLTTETNSTMSFYSCGNSEPLCYGYKRGVLQTPEKGGSNRRCLALWEKASFEAPPGIIWCHFAVE